MKNLQDILSVGMEYFFLLDVQKVQFFDIILLTVISLRGDN